MTIRYRSTRGQAPEVAAPEAILAGLAPDGGLYVPDTLPAIDVAGLAGLPYPELAAAMMAPFLPELADDLPRITREAYLSFEHPGVAPVTTTGDRSWLELFHGPTSAFKDMALQVLPRLVTASRAALGVKGRSLVLTATSGDTGKAALAGFAGVPGTEVVVFYPTDGVSAMQKRQMATQAGDNVHVIAIRGTFDDAQRGVKALFADPAFGAAVAEGGYRLTTANSINLGRLLPQVAYYVASWHQLRAAGTVAEGEAFDVVVPTGNFGNILAATWAKRLGVPITTLVCAANTNDVLARFLATGTYDARRPLVPTSSPSMDILVSSNLERYLWSLDADAVPGAMAALATDGTFTWPTPLPADLVGGSADEAAMAAALRRAWEADGVLLDPHTAVAAAVADQHRTGRHQLVAATASPYKFAPAVLAALGMQVPDDDFAAVGALHEATGVPVPEPLATLRGLPVLHDTVAEAGEMGEVLRRELA